jgi:hypothetical protein
MMRRSSSLRVAARGLPASSAFLGIFYDGEDVYDGEDESV